MNWKWFSRLPDVLYRIVRNLMEPRGFTIYGTRYDVDNRLNSVSIGSDQNITAAKFP